VDQVFDNIGVAFPQSDSDLSELLPFIFQLVLLGISVLALVYFLIGGVRFIISNGDESKTKAAKKTIVNAVIGLVIAFLSYIIVTAIINVLRNPDGIVDL
jgi:succinate dehydrogenase/fumarate reductase cytochrome b subunit